MELGPVGAFVFSSMNMGKRTIVEKQHIDADGIRKSFIFRACGLEWNGYDIVLLNGFLVCDLTLPLKTKK